MRRRRVLAGRRRRRGRQGRKGRRGASPEKFTDVRVERSPKGRKNPVRVKTVRRRNGEVSEGSFEI